MGTLFRIDQPTWYGQSCISNNGEDWSDIPPGSAQLPTRALWRQVERQSCQPLFFLHLDCTTYPWMDAALEEVRAYA